MDRSDQWCQPNLQRTPCSIIMACSSTVTTIVLHYGRQVHARGPGSVELTDHGERCVDDRGKGRGDRGPGFLDHLEELDVEPDRVTGPPCECRQSGDEGKYRLRMLIPATVNWSPP